MVSPNNNFLFSAALRETPTRPLGVQPEGPCGRGSLLVGGVRRDRSNDFQTRDAAFPLPPRPDDPRALQYRSARVSRDAEITHRVGGKPVVEQELYACLAYIKS